MNSREHWHFSPSFSFWSRFCCHINWRLIYSVWYTDLLGTIWCFSSSFSALGSVLGKQINQTQFLLVRSSQSGRLASPRGQITTVQFDKRDRYKVGQWRRGKCSAWVQRIKGRLEILRWRHLQAVCCPEVGVFQVDGLGKEGGYS